MSNIYDEKAIHNNIMKRLDESAKERLPNLSLEKTIKEKLPIQARGFEPQQKPGETKHSGDKPKIGESQQKPGEAKYSGDKPKIGEATYNKPGNGQDQSFKPDHQKSEEDQPKARENNSNDSAKAVREVRVKLNESRNNESFSGKTGKKEPGETSHHTQM